MRPEYDFSRAVRGKYWDRFHETSTAWVSRMATQDARQWSADVLLRFQRAEGILVAYFVLVRGFNVDDGSSAAGELFQNPNSSHDAAFWRDVHSHSDNGEVLQQCFATALPFRDWLLHRGLLQFDSGVPAQRDIERLEEAAEAASRLEAELRRFVLARCRANGLAQDEAIRKTSEVIEHWAAA